MLFLIWLLIWKVKEQPNMCKMSFRGSSLQLNMINIFFVLIHHLCNHFFCYTGWPQNTSNISIPGGVTAGCSGTSGVCLLFPFHIYSVVWVYGTGYYQGKSLLVHGIDDVIFNRLLSLLVKLVPEKLLKFLNIFMKRGIQNVVWYFIFVSLGLHSSTFFIRSHYYFHYLISINFNFPNLSRPMVMLSYLPLSSFIVLTCLF